MSHPSAPTDPARSVAGGADDVTLVGSSGGAVGAAPPLPQPGASLGRYVLGQRLGAGAMGVVFEAHDSVLDRPVAIKLLHAELPERARLRMQREGMILARFSHPNIVEVYEIHHSEGQTFIAMALVRGRTLAQWQQQEPPPTWQDAVRTYVQAGQALAAAHAAGFVHRDFKPGNCMLGDDGRVRVVDFGLALALGGGALDSASSAGAGTVDLATTKAGAFAGTPAYAPLEQVMGEVCDARADQYGFCASLYEAVYGERPTPGGSLAELVLALERGEIRPPPPGRRVPTSLRRALLRGLARDPALRWPSMDALLAALGRVLEPRRRWVAPVALAAALVPAAGVWLAWSGPDDPRCDDTALPLRGVWDDERREHAKTAMLATALPYASDAWARIEHDLDGYAGAWALEHAELCKVVRAGTQPSIDTTELRMGCLYERLVALRETVGLLAQANTTRVTNSVALVAGLPAISQCDDVDTLRAERQRPDDPELAARVDALREQLSKAARLDLAGEYDQALRMVDQLLAEAEALEHAPLPAELRLLEGKTLNHQGRFAEAGRELEQGYLLAVEHGLDDVAMVASLELSFALGRQARHDDALRWARAALVLSRGPDRKPVYEAFALRAVGDVMHEQGELAEALEHHRRALAILEQQFGPTHVDVALSLEQIGQTLQEQGEIEDAIAHQRRALAIYEQALGLGHPQTGASRSNLGMMLMEQGDFEGAVEQLRQALTIYEGALGPRHPNVGAAWANLGETLRQQDRLDDALDALRHAHVVFEQALGPAHPDTAKTLAAIGSVLLRKGELEAALEHQQRALASFEDVLGPRHPQVATLLHNIGVVSLQQGDTEQALEHFRRALAINEAALGADHPGIVPMLAAVADVELSQHELPAARAHAERMLSIEEAGGGAPASLAAARWLVARTSWPDPAQRARARALAQQARDAYATLGEDHRDRLAEIDAWLAEPGRR